MKKRLFIVRVVYKSMYYYINSNLFTPPTKNFFLLTEIVNLHQAFTPKARILLTPPSGIIVNLICEYTFELSLTLNACSLSALVLESSTTTSQASEFASIFDSSSTFIPLTLTFEEITSKMCCVNHNFSNFAGAPSLIITQSVWPGSLDLLFPNHQTYHGHVLVIRGCQQYQNADH